MPKIRHIAIVCQDPRKLATWYQQAFDFTVLHQSTRTDTTELTDGVINLTLLHADWVQQNTRQAWHFGVEMTLDEIEARRPALEALGATYHDGVRDGRSVEAYVEDPEGHRIDMAPHWMTKPGEPQRRHEYQTWQDAPLGQA